MWNQLLPALRMTLLLTVLTGLIYPGVVTGLCQLLFRGQANGSLIARDGKVVGSSLIGQSFSRPEYLYSRLSAVGYDASASGGSNLGPTSQKLMDRTRESARKARSDNPSFQGMLPADLPSASGSGLDPHISPASAILQAARVAAARGVPEDQVRQLIGRYTEQRDWGLLGEPRVNVLAVNLALNEAFPVRR